MNRSNKTSQVLYNLLSAVAALVFSLLVGGVILAVMGVEPIKTYKALFSGAFGSPASLSGTLTRLAPTILCGLAVAVGFQGSVFNVGAEGQFIMGALFATMAGYYLKLPAMIHIPVIMVAGILGGITWVYTPTILRFKRGVNVIFSTIMFNHIAKFLILYLVNNPLSAENKQLGATEKIQETAMLPSINIGAAKVNLSMFCALFAVVIVWIFLSKTRYGYEMRATGLNIFAAGSAGVDTKKRMMLSMLLSGALAGLAGSLDLAGSAYRLYSTYSPGYGGTGITVALLANNNPWAVVLSGLLFAAMKNGAVMMQTTASVSSELVSLLQGLIIFFICSENLISYFLRKVKKGDHTI